MSMSIKSLASELQQQFTHSTRTAEAGGDTYYHLKDGAPEWMTDVIHFAHGNTLPDDTIYEIVRDCVNAIADECDDDADADECRDAISSIEPEHRTYQLFMWAARWSEYIEEATSIYGKYEIESSGDLDNLFQAAQMCQIEEVGALLIQALEQRADELNAEDDETEETEIDE